jgi:hypothetical protein
MFFDRLFSFLVDSDCDLHHSSDEDVGLGIFRQAMASPLLVKGREI